MNEVFHTSILVRLNYLVSKMKPTGGYQFRQEDGTLRNGEVTKYEFKGWVDLFQHHNLSRGELRAVLLYANQLSEMISNGK